jgi:3-hydroxyacyl-[acyl-carrier-protein] dehydratase
VVSLEPGKSLTAIKNVTFNEPFFAGHFPEYPVMPGVLIIEALAQACCVLAYFTMQSNNEQYDTLSLLAGIDNARFKRVVEPGDQLILKTTLIRTSMGIAKFSCVACVGDEVACTADLLSAQKK